MPDIEYMKTGDYYIPALTTDDIPEKPIGKYGLMRRRHLEQNDKVLFTLLQLEDRLYRHLAEIDDTARNQVELFIEQMLRKEPPPDRNTSPMEWVRHMEMLKLQAEEIVTRELIFA